MQTRSVIYGTKAPCIAATYGLAGRLRIVALVKNAHYESDSAQEQKADEAEHLAHL